MDGNDGPIKGENNKARVCDVNQLFVIRLDPSIINGANNGRPRVNNFHLSNPKLGEQLQHFILTSLRGPKVVQSIISELESQGALRRSNLRDTLLVVCCGSRYNTNTLNFRWELMPPLSYIVREKVIALRNYGLLLFEIV
ncbi:putative HAUS augmin-like complex subunit 6 [Helianthus debilis subsp. tardiflorus]